MEEFNEMTKMVQIEVDILLHNKLWYSYKQAKKADKSLQFAKYLRDIWAEEVEKHYPI